MNLNALLYETRMRFRELYAWISYCYRSMPPHLWTGDCRFQNVVGVQQSNSLGPVMFALALHPAPQMLQVHLRSATTNSSDLQLLTFFADDGVIIVEHFFDKDLDFLNSSEVEGHGIHLIMPKFRVWWSTEPAQALRLAYLSVLSQNYSDGTNLLQVPNCLSRVHSYPSLRSLEVLTEAHLRNR